MLDALLLVLLVVVWALATRRPPFRALDGAVRVLGTAQQARPTPSGDAAPTAAPAETEAEALVELVSGRETAPDLAPTPAGPTALVVVPRAPLAPARGLPVVFVHGFAGFREIGVGRARQAYFRGVAPRLAARGVDAHFVEVPPLAPVRVRAEALARALSRLAASRVHVVAHSMGGLDARWAIAHLGLDEAVQSLVTVGTPHHGTPLAELGERVLGRATDKVRSALGAVFDLTPERAALRNLHVPDSPRVRYASVTVAPRRGARGVSPALLPSFLLLAHRAGPNDGVVPVSSQRWGEDWGTVDTDHWGAVGWSLRFDAPAFYESLVARLAAVLRAQSVTTSEPRRTSLHEDHVALGGKLVPFAGFAMPLSYAGTIEEHKAVRSAAGLFDVSHMGELSLEGEHALDVVDYLVTNDAKKLEDGQAMYTCCCNEEGTILDDLIVYKAERRRILVVCNASNREKIVAHFRKACEHHCSFQDVSDDTALLALQGPKAMGILAKAGREAAACGELKSFRFRDAIVANVHCTVARTGYTGEDGVEIFCRWSDAPHLWRTLLELGREDGLVPVGLGARDTLRLEARLSLYGNDIDETTNPLEAGLGWVTKLDKGDFVGRAALQKVKAEGLRRTLVGFEMRGRGIGRHGYPLKAVDGSVVGVVTSGGPAPTLGKNIGLGYVPLSMKEPGTTLVVDCRGKDIEAVVVKTPFYKR